MKTKFIFVTGGVCSSLGKGIIASSVAAILRSGGKKVAIMKLDPYLNVDPGTMSPFQHGEVFVLDDGGETDLDLGHYERFIDTPLNKACSVTTGRVYSEVLNEEREGKYLGGTIQIVPHITNKILQKVEAAAEQLAVDVLVVEIGGTVGDIEAEPFLESLRQMKNKYGKNCLSFHATLLPYLAASKELKTKPTQLSVREMRRVGIQPDIIFARADVKIAKNLLEKISYFCDIPVDCIIRAETVKSIYEVPLRFQSYNLGKIINEKLDLGIEKFDMKIWEDLQTKIDQSQKVLEIALAGKYIDLDDAYLSVIEAIKSAGFAHNYKVKINWIDTEKIEEDDEKTWEILRKSAGIIVPGGFGDRGIEGKIKVAEYCRKNKKPYLGICLGSQTMAIEFARNVMNLSDANGEEFDKDKKSSNHIVHFIPEQRNIRRKGGTMRLGSYDCQLKTDSLAFDLYKKETIKERHRHRYEFNNKYRADFEENGFIISGTSPDNELVEVVEIKDHPFMIGVQFHPEFLSRPFRPHPLFLGLIESC
jgi:CTP synthase